ncbi:3127_t:CDS:2, partial [Cetraspora pellucida]
KASDSKFKGIALSQRSWEQKRAYLALEDEKEYNKNTIEDDKMSFYCNRCNTYTDHQSIFCLQTQCLNCKEFGHINFYCPTLPCRVCKGTDHTLQTCQYESIHSKNYIYGKTNRWGLLDCGCNKRKLVERREELHKDQVTMSKKRQYHCCNCKAILYINKITKINEKFLCFRCKKQFIERLPDNDIRKIEFINSPENQRDIVVCVVCKKTHHRFSYLDGIGDFCDYHCQAAYKVYQDIQNPNKDLWTRIRHWTETEKLSAYKMNQSAILRTVLIMKNFLSLLYEKALEDQIGDFFNSASETDDDDWYSEDYSFTRVMRSLKITPEEQKEKERLRKIIVESFTFNSDIDVEDILDSLHERFGKSIKDYTFCKSCWYIIKKTENNLCSDCDLENISTNNENNDFSDNRIILLENKIEELVKQIDRLKIESEYHRTQVDQYKAPFLLFKNFIKLFNDTKEEENLITLL